MSTPESAPKTTPASAGSHGSAFVTGWRYYWRRYLGWLPVQFCMVCGKPYWGGFPEMEFYLGRLVNTWQAWMMDYCSMACCEKDMESEAPNSPNTKVSD